jgi:hypothetical protein
MYVNPRIIVVIFLISNCSTDSIYVYPSFSLLVQLCLGCYNTAYFAIVYVHTRLEEDELEPQRNRTFIYFNHLAFA